MDSTRDGAPAALAAPLDAAHAAADAAAAVTLAGFRADLPVDDKGAGRGDGTGGGGVFDPVTRADREAEAVIRAALAERCPDVGFVGEESAGGAGAGERGASGAAAGRRWIVDPIDGTRAYIAGIPVWGTLVALADGAEPVLGLMDQPWLGERFVGHPDGAVLHDRHGTRPLRARTGRRLGAAVLCATSPEMFPAADRAAFDRVAADALTVRWGTDCYGYAMLAAGHVDAVVEAGLSAWDVAALVPVVRGAGGVVTDWRGGPPLGASAVVAAGSAALHAEVLARLDAAR